VLKYLLNVKIFIIYYGSQFFYFFLPQLSHFSEKTFTALGHILEVDEPLVIKDSRTTSEKTRKIYIIIHVTKYIYIVVTKYSIHLERN
jgi:hypothetical protein